MLLHCNTAQKSARKEFGLNTTITVDSVTYAIKAKKLLERRGIRCKLIKVNSSAVSNGCNYGISIASSLFYDAVLVLKNNGIVYSVYTGNGIS